MPSQFESALCHALPSHVETSQILRHSTPVLCVSSPLRCISSPCHASAALRWTMPSPRPTSLCQSFARLSPCSAAQRSAVPRPCVAFPSRGYTIPPRLTAPPRLCLATLCRSWSLLCISLAEPLPASQFLSTAGQRLAKQCLSCAVPIPRLALQNYTVPLLSHAMPKHNVSKQCPIRSIPPGRP